MEKGKEKVTIVVEDTKDLSLEKQTTFMNMNVVPANGILKTDATGAQHVDNHTTDHHTEGHEVLEHHSDEGTSTPEGSGESTYQYEEWHSLLERSNFKYMTHYKSSRFWLALHEAINIIMILLSAVITANGIGDLFNKTVLMVLGICMVVFSSVNIFLNPSSNYTKHNTVSKRYRELYHRIRNCDTMKIFSELQKLFENIEKEAPDTPIFMNSKGKVQYVFMHPSLQEEFKKYYTYKTNPIKFKSHSFRL